MEQYLETVLDTLLRAQVGEPVRRESGVFFSAHGLAVYPSVRSVKQNGQGSWLAIVDYRVEAPHFLDMLEDCATGFGPTEEEALENTVKNLFYSALGAVGQYTQGHMQQELDSECCGKSMHWRMTGAGFTMGVLTERVEDLWQLIKGALPARLGFRRVYWLKCYGAKQANGEITAEIYINNQPDKELSQLFYQSAEKWDNGGAFFSWKYYFILVQDEATFVCYPHTKEQVEEKTLQAAMLFHNMETDDEEGPFVERLTAKIQDPLLAAELHALLPEMCAAHHFHTLRRPDDIGFYINGEQWQIYKSQITPYYWIRDALLAGFSEGKLPQDLYGKLIGYSSVGKVVFQARQTHPDLDLSTVGMAIVHNMPDGYRVR